MQIEALIKVSTVMDELQRRINALLDANAYDPHKGTVRDGSTSLSFYPMESAAVRRQSMELTRALAELRRS